MHEFLAFALIGLGTGAIYTLMALGVVAAYRGSNTINFAAGGIALAAAESDEWLTRTHGWPIWPTFCGVVLVAALLGVVIYQLILRPLRYQTQLTRAVATLGVFTVLLGLSDTLFASQPPTAISELPLTPIRVPIINEVTGENRLILLGISIAATAALVLWSSRSRLALATRAVADHERATQSLGYSPHLIGSVNWALGCALAGAAGILIAPIVGLTAEAITATAVFALAAALVGNFNSYGLALAGGLGIGVLQGLVTHYASDWLPTANNLGWDQAVPFVCIMVILLVRRDRASNRLPPVQAPPIAAARFRPLPIAIGVAAALALLSFASLTWIDAAIVSASFGILALSLVVLIGYANQISLAQMTIAGLGAFAAAKLSINLGVPFVLLPVAGAAAGALAGLLVGLPSLRIRGMSLAITTLALGLAVSSVLFENSTYTGAEAGLQPRPLKFFGLPADPATHARTYAFIAFGWLVLCALGVAAVRRSGLGRQLAASRTNERSATSIGVSVAHTKLAAFVVSSAIAGCGGVLLAFSFSTVTFSNFTFSDSINLVVLVVVVGAGSVTGGLVAGVLALNGLLYVAFQDLHLTFINKNYATIFGVGLLLSLLRHPNGLTWRSGMLTAPAERFSVTPAVPEPAALKVQDLSVSFGGVRSLIGVTVEASPGSVVGLIGPNGAGKSTLLDAISGFAAPQKGEIDLRGEQVGRWPGYKRARAGIGRVFQGLDLFEDLKLLENLNVAAENAGNRGRALTESSWQFIEQFGLADKLGQLPRELPLADRKFAAIGRALAGNPSVVLLDEPSAGLSIADVGRLRDALRSVVATEHVTLVIVDHNMNLMMDACDSIVVLVNGQVLMSGPPSLVAADPRVRAAYLGESSSSPKEEGDLSAVSRDSP